MGSVTKKCKNLSVVRGLAYHRRVYRTLKQWQKTEAQDQKLVIEPWLRHSVTRQLLQPDSVIVDLASNTGLVVEVKLNWKDGRDVKLLGSYLPAVKEAFDLDDVYPALITSNVAGLKYEPRLGLKQLLACDDWEPGAPTPVVLFP